MPKNKFQEVIFTIIMVFVMVYAMICYNIVLNTGTMTNETFLLAFHELTFMGPIAFILDFFIIGGLAKKIAFGIVDMRRDNPFHLVLAISAVSVAFMCPCMSFAATELIKQAPASQIIPTWLQTTAMNFPMAFFWQIFYAGPFVRFIFGKLFPEKEKAAASAELKICNFDCSILYFRMLLFLCSYLYVTVHSVLSNVAKIHSRLPAAMEFWLVCLGILAYSCQNTSRDSDV